MTQSTSEASLEEPICFCCNLPSASKKESLHLVQSFQLDQWVRRSANILQDSFLHDMLQNGDMITGNAMYNKA